MSAFSVN